MKSTIGRLVVSCGAVLELLNEYAGVLGVVHRDMDELHSALSKCVFQGGAKLRSFGDVGAGGGVGPCVGDEVGVAEGHAIVGEPVNSLFPADHAVGVVIEDHNHEVEAEADGGSSSWLFIMNPPSPQTAMTRRPGCRSAAAIAEGRPAPMVARALSSRSVFAVVVR